jgi:predicted lysophospholipase L1 biosynthesis ABC-type transport system permease subunit
MSLVGSAVNSGARWTVCEERKSNIPLPSPCTSCRPLTLARMVGVLQFLLYLSLAVIPLAAIFAVYCRLLPSPKWMRRWLVVLLAGVVLLVVTYGFILASLGSLGAVD